MTVSHFMMTTVNRLASLLIQAGMHANGSRKNATARASWFHTLIFAQSQAGYAGLEDGVDNHWGQLFRAAGLATILNIGLETGEDGGDEIAEAIRDGTQDTIGRAGEAIVQRQLQIPPTLTIRPGFPVRVMVTRDLILEPQGDAR